VTLLPDAAIRIRRMRIDEDLDGIGAVDAASFTNPWTRDMYLWEAAHSDVARVFVAVHDEAGIVAYCAVWVVFDELQVNNLAVLPAWRARGLARRLLAEVFRAARDEGATCATLEVRASNAPAIALYEGLGFVRTAIRAGYYTHPVEDAWIYWRHDLDPVELA
jgi:ribosomal-protein-alanine N-acetyltransferase